MAPFAGYMMPLNYGDGALKEHMARREGAAIFDVSHMAQLDITHASATASPILSALEGLIPANLIDLPAGKQRYGLFLNARGGIIDDLMVINAGDYVRLVANAACAEKDQNWLQTQLSGFKITRRQRALVAVQGPAAADVVAAHLLAARLMHAPLGDLPQKKEYPKYGQSLWLSWCQPTPRQ